MLLDLFRLLGMFGLMCWQSEQLFFLGSYKNSWIGELSNLDDIYVGIHLQVQLQSACGRSSSCSFCPEHLPEGMADDSPDLLLHSWAVFSLVFIEEAVQCMNEPNGGKK